MHGRIWPNGAPTKKWRVDMLDPELLRLHMLHRHKGYDAARSPDAAAVMAIEWGHNDVLHHLMVCGKLRDYTLLSVALMYCNVEAADMLYERGLRVIFGNSCTNAIAKDCDDVVDWVLAHMPPFFANNILTTAFIFGKERYVQKAIAAGALYQQAPPELLYNGMKARMECLIAVREPTNTGFCFLSKVYEVAAVENDVDTIEWMASKGVKRAT